MRELAARPDVRAAEQSVAVYYATNQARASFYPALPSRLPVALPLR